MSLHLLGPLDALVRVGEEPAAAAHQRRRHDEDLGAGGFLAHGPLQGVAGDRLGDDGQDPLPHGDQPPERPGVLAGRRTVADARHTRAPVPAPTADILAERLRPLTEAPDRSAILCDVDGTLAPIVERAEQAAVPQEVSRLLGTMARRYRCVACISGRSAAEARRLVGVGGIAYAGSHGAELLEPGASQARVMPAFAEWTDRVHSFVDARDVRQLRSLRIRVEDKGAIMAFHWRGAPDEERAERHVEEIAREAEATGFATHWGRKVLEVRPPVPVDKGRPIRELIRSTGAQRALFGGDDSTDLDAFAALDELVSAGELEVGLKVGIRSEDGPEAVVRRADLAVDGTQGFAALLTILAA
jgi:trehalose 6-phosphate phosphatase